MRNYQALYNALKKSLVLDLQDASVDCCTAPAHDDIVRAQGRWSKVQDWLSRIEELEDLEAQGLVSDLGDVKSAPEDAGS